MAYVSLTYLTKVRSKRLTFASLDTISYVLVEMTLFVRSR